MSARKAYLGDGVYADMEPSGMIRLTVEDGRRATDVIFLEPEVYVRLTAYVSQSWTSMRGGPDDATG